TTISKQEKSAKNRFIAVFLTDFSFINCQSREVQYSGTNERWSIIYGLIFQNAKKSCLSLQFTVKSFLNFAIIPTLTVYKRKIS
ncbi:MAG: hypothetical protein WBV27_11420, partial [Trichococcus sp.]|uniref:hypothetical protein n=1 Tax=Trichococcus sp. TaxID=1985464 RepID=UPI003C3D9858